MNYHFGYDTLVWVLVGILDASEFNMWANDTAGITQR